MVSDTAITGGTIDLRQRDYLPKIEPSLTRDALIGFAGDPDIGTHLVRLAAAEQSAERAIKILIDGSRNAHVEFAYACFDAFEPRLFRIENGDAKCVPTLHLGTHQAFEHLQKIRLEETAPYSPLAFKNFIAGAKVKIPNRLSHTTRCMIDLFASRQEHDVGGWATPYFLTDTGTHFCGYAYGVSDPLFDKLAPGSLIPHGTAEQGGSTLSVTEIGDGEGMIIYWLQIPGGTVLVRKSDGYRFFVVTGRPSSFKQEVEQLLGRPVDLWIGDQPPGPVKASTTMRDESGNINAVVADHGGSLTFAVHNMTTPFHSVAELALQGSETRVAERTAIAVAPGKDSVSIQIRSEEHNVSLNAADLDRLIFSLGQARAEMSEHVPLDLPQGTKIAAQIDPRWIANVSPHPSLAGILLNLRHSGLGWLGFVLPPHEARALGKWLLDHSENSGR